MLNRLFNAFVVYSRCNNIAGATKIHGADLLKLKSSFTSVNIRHVLCAHIKQSDDLR